MFLESCRTHRKPVRMMVKKDGDWTRISTDEIETTVRRLSLGLQALGIGPGDRVAILSENRPEWVMADFAALAAGAVTVPIYTSLPPDQIGYIIGDSGAKIVVCSDLDLWSKVEAVRSGLPALERGIVIEGDPPAGAHALSDVVEMGRRLEEEEPGRFERKAGATRPGDLASIIYTSGTTGRPKGVMLSHANFASNVLALTEVIDFCSDDTALSFLPLSHVFERTATFFQFHVGAAIAYAESVEAVASNMIEVRPTIVVSVPRLFEKIYSRIMDQIMAGSRLKRGIFVWALATGKKYAARTIAGARVPAHLALKRGLARKLVFSKITARTGGRVRYFICGGAPISKDIIEFFFAIGLMVLPGYGLTETSPVLSANTPPDRIRFGTVGKVLPGIAIRIAGDGEILARGPNIMMGYYKNDADTARSSRTAGSTPATSAGSTRTGSSSSPTARRTSSSLRAARTSPPSRSRASSRPAPTSPAPSWSAAAASSSRPSSCRTSTSSSRMPGRTDSPSGTGPSSAGSRRSPPSSSRRSTG
jgi:long-chain acyl-CoA synthetase